ncbi:MAG: 50S ribosomal protein L23 [Bacteroidales bacterium]|jgi:large subunit ribosomal protein L23|nr:50S ribosomal protein L23 [Bacteroidales bacterium]
MSILIKPLISEKMTHVAEQFNRYGFIVDRKATKSQIKKEIEDLYGIKVVRINTLVQRGKSTSRYTKAGMIEGQKNTVKKAYVFVSKDDKIDFFSSI